MVLQELVHLMQQEVQALIIVLPTMVVMGVPED